MGCSNTKTLFLLAMQISGEDSEPFVGPSGACAFSLTLAFVAAPFSFAEVLMTAAAVLSADVVAVGRADCRRNSDGIGAGFVSAFFIVCCCWDGWWRLSNENDESDDSIDAVGGVFLKCRTSSLMNLQPTTTTICQFCRKQLLYK